MVADGKVRSAANLHAGAIAIVPRLSGVGDDIALPLQFAVTQQGLLENGALVSQLRRVSAMLIVAAAAAAKVRARWLHAVGGRLEHLVDGGAREAAFFLHDGGAHLLRRQYERKKYRLALG